MTLHDLFFIVEDFLGFVLITSHSIFCQIILIIQIILFIIKINKINKIKTKNYLQVEMVMVGIGQYLAGL